MLIIIVWGFDQIPFKLEMWEVVQFDTIEREWYMHANVDFYVNRLVNYLMKNTCSTIFCEEREWEILSWQGFVIAILLDF